MSRASARLLLAACVLSGALLAFSFARSEETLVWTANTNGDLISLSYGSLDTSKPPVLLLSCFNEMSIGVLEIFGTIQGTRPGQKLSIDLSAGGTQSSSEGAIELDDQSGTMFAEASDVEIAPLLAISTSLASATFVPSSSIAPSLEDCVPRRRDRCSFSAGRVPGSCRRSLAPQCSSR